MPEWVCEGDWFVCLFFICVLVCWFIIAHFLVGMYVLSCVCLYLCGVRGKCVKVTFRQNASDSPE